MKKNLLITVLLLTSAFNIFATELDIINKTLGTMDVRPILSLMGKQSYGRKIAHITHGETVKYNSGLYKIVGCEVWLNYRMSGNRVSRYYGFMHNWPAIDVTNRNAAFVLDKDNVGWIYKNKNNLAANVHRAFFKPSMYDVVEASEEWHVVE
jgi:hypothetical protein